jgi:hypothetical protein
MRYRTWIFMQPRSRHRPLETYRDARGNFFDA